MVQSYFQYADTDNFAAMFLAIANARFQMPCPGSAAETAAEPGSLPAWRTNFTGGRDGRAAKSCGRRASLWPA